MKKALVIGGTGMLAEVSLWLSSEGFQVHVLARNKQKMDQLIQKVDSGYISPIFTDYKNESELKKEMTKLDGIELVVAWIHSDAPMALNTILQELSPKTEQFQVFQVVGSRTDLEGLKNSLNLPQNVKYHQIKLGFVIENGGSRWLINKEISSGVIEAIKSNDDVKIVGTVEPWEKRPN
ncbi:short-chain dehydrogenase [Neobacillus terrae]|uniref:short-chain dehydrogenase n=1 Tax=Neobacillus terrae TaxID=3034837 RepID=UPI001409C796|nr:short-chain dehydrogenase [Neobacillus terrae]NHM33755.1 short-chain dehydrogenase [Neobacillus terrae]